MQYEAQLRHYLASIQRDLKSGRATEHTYRGTLKALLESMANGITATNEPKREACGAPDYIITRERPHGALTIGYVEAKDVGVALDKVEKSDQLKRYLPNLGNLILTDYVEFRWYINGEPRKSARLAKLGENTLTFDAAGAEQVEQMLLAFLTRSPEPIRSPRELAQRMARLTHLIRDLTLDTFSAEQHAETAAARQSIRDVVTVLTDLHKAFKETLIPELTEKAFADMFAQTLAYGLFAARVNHRGETPFERRDAAREVPKTNPFLRKLFETISGTDLDDAPFVGFVDDLAQLLNETDMAAVLRDFGKRTRQEDPIVHFYETFLTVYDPELRRLRGVYYTPEPVVSYIVRSVDRLLRTEFECDDGLVTGRMRTNDKQVVILDPACGTGTFLYNVIDHIRASFGNNAGMWPGYVKEELLPRIFGFELLMAPYAVAHLKLGMQLAGWDLPEAARGQWSYHGDDRLNVYLTNTLEEAARHSERIMARYLSDEANAAASVKKDSPVMVILGNPPYSGHSANKGEWISRLMRGEDVIQGTGKDAVVEKTANYFEVDGKHLNERNPKWLNDDYVKFIRFAQWRIERTGYGIIAFITNNGYLDNPTFRGMRQSLMQTFDDVYVLDLHGNGNKKERSPDGSVDQNVFDILQGVAIAIFIKRKNNSARSKGVYHAQLFGAREVYATDGNSEPMLIGGKYHWLNSNDIQTTRWTTLSPQAPSYQFVPRNPNIAKEYTKCTSITEIFPINNVGIVTARDSLSIHFIEESIWNTVQDFAKLGVEEARVKYKLGEDAQDWKVDLAQQDIRAKGIQRKYLTPILYRPFDNRITYYTGTTKGFMCRPRPELMRNMLSGPNLGLISTRQTKDKWDVLATNKIVGHKSLAAYDINTLFPLYIYPEVSAPSLFDMHPQITANTSRRPNLSSEFLGDIAARLGLQWIADGKGNLVTTFGPEDVFNYIYAIFYSPVYRERYAEYLDTDFPRVPLTNDIDLFRSLCSLGDTLISMHLLEKYGPELPAFPVPGNNFVEEVRYTKPVPEGEPGRVYINQIQYFENVPPETWEYHVGGYQVAQKWLKDRKGRMLSYEDQRHYQRTLAALTDTMRLMEEIDAVIEEHGGWPLQ